MSNLNKYKDFIKRTRRFKGSKDDIMSLLEDIVLADIEKFLIDEEGFGLYNKDIKIAGINKQVFIKVASRFGLLNDYGIYFSDLINNSFGVFVVEREGYEWVLRDRFSFNIKKEEFVDFYNKNLEDYF